MNSEEKYSEEELQTPVSQYNDITQNTYMMHGLSFGIVAGVIAMCFSISLGQTTLSAVCIPMGIVIGLAIGICIKKNHPTHKKIHGHKKNPNSKHLTTTPTTGKRTQVSYSFGAEKPIN